jgi:hypothetical protein
MDPATKSGKLRKIRNFRVDIAPDVTKDSGGDNSATHCVARDASASGGNLIDKRGAAMLLIDKVSESLTQLKGLESVEPKSVSWADDNKVGLEIDFVAVESLSCAFRELRFTAPSLRDASLDVLRAWSKTVCDRITYLLEHIGPLEVDPLSMTVLIRSTPPERDGGRVSFYEIVVHPTGCLSLRRFSRTRGEPERRPQDIRVTHEVLRKLVQDLVGSVPTSASDPASSTA